jgi:hypothetical protein
MNGIRRHPRPRSLPQLGVLVCVAGLLTACGPHSGVTIGMRSTALSLQFARPDLAKPIPPNVITKILPTPPNPPAVLVPNPKPSATPTVPVPPIREYPAPKSALPLKASTSSTPRAGYYSVATKGNATVSDGTRQLTLPIPDLTQVAVSAATSVEADSTAPLEGGAPASGKEPLYTVTTQLSDTVKQIDKLAVSASSINLVERTVTDGRRSLSVTPTPQIQLMVFGPVGTTWRSDGTDSGNTATISYTGTIARVTAVKVCGQVVKAYVVSYTESMTSPLDQERIRTSKGSTNTMTIAPQLGGLVIGQQVHTDDLRYDSDLGGYIEIWMDYKAALTRLQPSKTGPAA